MELLCALRLCEEGYWCCRSWLVSCSALGQALFGLGPSIFLQVSTSIMVAKEGGAKAFSCIVNKHIAKSCRLEVHPTKKPEMTQICQVLPSWQTRVYWMKIILGRPYSIMMITWPLELAGLGSKTALLFASHVTLGKGLIISVLSFPVCRMWMITIVPL